MTRLFLYGRGFGYGVCSKVTIDISIGFATI